MEMLQIIEFLRVPIAVVHIAAGVVCLGVGTYLAMARKGTSLHRQLGRLYFRGMMIVCATGIVMAMNSRNYMLLLIAVFSGYMALAGYRAPMTRKEGRYRWIDHAAAWSMMSIGIAMLIWGVMLGSVVLVVFGGIGSAMAAQEIIPRHLTSPATIPGILLPRQGRRLDRRHRIMMSGSLIALWTAFLVNNVSIEPAWALWLLPTVIGSAAITRSLRKQPA